MTEKQYLMEMLCCTPLELLNGRISNDSDTPTWLAEIDTSDVKRAIELYEEPKYKRIREEMKRTL